jgi:hypothetical protein
LIALFPKHIVNNGLIFASLRFWYGSLNIIASKRRLTICELDEFIGEMNTPIEEVSA